MSPMPPKRPVIKRRTLLLSLISNNWLVPSIAHGIRSKIPIINVVKVLGNGKYLNRIMLAIPLI